MYKEFVLQYFNLKDKEDFEIINFVKAKVKSCLNSIALSGKDKNDYLFWQEILKELTKELS